MKFYMFIVTNDNGRTAKREVTDLTTRQQNAAAQRMANELQRPVMLQNQTAKKIGPYTSTMNHGLFNPK